MKISIEKLKEIGACQKGKDYFLDVIGEGKYTIKECIDKIKASGNYPSASDVSWLMRHVPEYRTPEMFEYYKSLNPSYFDVSWLLIKLPESRTPEMLDYYKSLNPSYSDVSWLLDGCPELIVYFIKEK